MVSRSVKAVTAVTGARAAHPPVVRPPRFCGFSRRRNRARVTDANLTMCVRDREQWRYYYIYRICDVLCGRCRFWLSRHVLVVATAAIDNKKKKKNHVYRAAVTGRELLGNYTVDPVVVVSIHRPREHRDRVASVLVLVVYSFFFPRLFSLNSLSKLMIEPLSRRTPSVSFPRCINDVSHIIILCVYIYL